MTWYIYTANAEAFATTVAGAEAAARQLVADSATQGDRATIVGPLTAELRERLGLPDAR